MTIVHRTVLAAALLAASSFGCERPLNPAACSNHDAGWCGEGKFCYHDQKGGWDECRALDGGASPDTQLDAGGPADLFPDAGGISDGPTPGADVALLDSASADSAPPASDVSTTPADLSTPADLGAAPDAAAICSEESCNGYRCAGNMCRTVCDVDTECVSTHFCSIDHKCRARCAPKSPDNIVANPGFDTAIWPKFGSPRDGEALPRWDSIDSKGCMTSGSLRVSERVAISDVFPMQAGRPYHWGFAVKRPATRDGLNTTECHLTYCRDMGCDDLIDYSQFLWPKLITDEWQQLSAVETPPPSTVAAYIICYTHGVEAANFDRFFVNPVAPLF